MLPSIYEFERTMRDFSQARLKEAENERRARLAMQAVRELRQSTDSQQRSQAETPLTGMLASRLLRLLRG